MQYYSSAKKLLPLRNQLMRANNKTIIMKPRQPCDVFINHRGTDTKRTISGLLYSHLQSLGLRPFLDKKNMKPGDRLLDNINAGIMSCKVGVAVFSPRYCESYFCLHELALMMDKGKRVVPIFCDMKPSQLRVIEYERLGCCKNDLERFHRALEEAKYTVGLTFDTLTGDWSDFLTKATDAIVRNLIEVEDEDGVSADVRNLIEVENERLEEYHLIEEN